MPANIQQVVIPIGEISDSFLFFYVQKLMQNSAVQVTFLDIQNTIKQHIEIKESIRVLEQSAPNQVEIIYNAEDSLVDFTLFDLMLISQFCWKTLIDDRKNWINSLPSTLILKP